MSHHTVISTDALAAHAHTDDWIVVDCRYDLQDEERGHAQYRSGHIPGAVYASLSHDLSGPKTGTNGRHPLPSREATVAAFSRLGIAPGAQVVAYDQDSGMFASRLWWMLRAAGHDAVAVLDGGWAKWMREGRPSRSGDESPAPAMFSPQWRDVFVQLEDVQRLAGDSSTLLLDARTAERFEGRVEPLDRAPGHIPGARNHSYRDNLASDGTLLPPDVLRTQLQQALGSHPPDRTVMYCGSGVSACHNLLAMAHAGLDGARLYVGSWSEWSADPTRPVETGPARPR